MRDRRKLTLQTTAGPIPVQAYPTDTGGLYVYRNGDAWRLAHHTGHTLGEFQSNQDAHDAARALADLTDWTRTAEQLHVDLAVFVYELHDAIHDAGGTFLYRSDGPAAQALAARGD